MPGWSSARLPAPRAPRLEGKGTVNPPGVSHPRPVRGCRLTQISMASFFESLFTALFKYTPAVFAKGELALGAPASIWVTVGVGLLGRSEEHISELQSRPYLVFR